MPKLVPIKGKLLIQLLKRLGFIERDAEGSHVFLKHPDGRTTLIHKEQNLYVAEDMELGTASQGTTKEEALQNLQEATALYLEEFLA